MTATSKPLAPGEQFHALHTGLTVLTTPGALASSVVLRRGQTVTVTDALREASRDREGRSWLDLVDDADAQIARWGRQMIARGPAPDDLTTWEPGSVEAQEAREQARREAWALPTEEARRDALAAVERIYGPAVTSRTLRTVTERTADA